MNSICERLLFCLPFSVSVRFRIIDNGHLQIRGIKKTDEGMYNCEARVMARGEIDFRMIKVVVNGKHFSLTFCSLPALFFEKRLLFSPENVRNGNLGNVLFET